MGCDIHCYLEYRNPEDKNWSSLGDEFRLDRSYMMFSRLADVRNYEQINAIAANRGLPSDVSWRTKDGATLYVSETDPGGEGNASKEDADRWVESGTSTRVAENRVTHPDWHSHSWCTAEELTKAIEWVERDVNGLPLTHEYRAIVAAMNQLEKSGFEARMVFWFDN